MYLFEHGLKPGGVYIVEDIEMNYLTKGTSDALVTGQYGKDHPNSLINQMKDLVDVVNREYSKPTKRYTSKFGTYVDKWISSITFGPNCVIITKMTEKELQIYGSRRYRFPDSYFN